MKMLKRFIMIFVLLDNVLTNLTKKIFRTRWQLTGKCRQCGNCCKKIILTMTPAQTKSPIFRQIAIAWISWLFDFILLEIDYQHNNLAFTCQHLTKEGKCGNYFWRPNICRNYPLVDYFAEPKFLPGCGFNARDRDRR
ncbi:MAG: YkgJ family cysteine cluster protein [Candidatus Margulisbacteria bacterium]|nr:YkgJ family cysteine cluster protein [Candidatus Margulisiibacteriota bacterium]